MPGSCRCGNWIRSSTRSYTFIHIPTQEIISTTLPHPHTNKKTSHKNRKPYHIVAVGEQHVVHLLIFERGHVDRERLVLARARPVAQAHDHLALLVCAARGGRCDLDHDRADPLVARGVAHPEAHAFLHLVARSRFSLLATALIWQERPRARARERSRVNVALGCTCLRQQQICKTSASCAAARVVVVVVVGLVTNGSRWRAVERDSQRKCAARSITHSARAIRLDRALFRYCAGCRRRRWRGLDWVTKEKTGSEDDDSARQTPGAPFFPFVLRGGKEAK